MKKLTLLLLLFATAFAAGAQKVYFIYVQTDNAAPFYVRIGNETQSSTASGFLILSNLRDSTYELRVGFPGGGSESRFSVPLDHEDRGFVLKQVSGAWNLFDLQSMALIKALAAVGPTAEQNQQLLAQADPFTRMLVEASDDMSLLLSGPSAPAPANLAASEGAPAKTAAPATAAVVMPPSMKPVAPTTTNTMMSAGSQVAAQTIASLDSTTAGAVIDTPYVRSQVTRRSESSTTEGFGLVFIDKQTAGSDTIRILIPNPREAPKAAIVPDQPEKKTEIAAAPVTNAGEQPLQVSKDTVLVVHTDTIVVAPVVTEVAKAGAVARCTNMAEDKDFFKLRKNMAASSDEAEMVAIGRKALKSKCYTTEQVRYLGGLFLTELGRYNFFEAAQGHVSDPAQYASLEKELKDAYFSKRFHDLLAR